MLKQIIDDLQIRYESGSDTVLSLDRVHTEDTATFTCAGEFRGELVQDVSQILLRYIQAGFIVWLDFAKVTYIANSMQEALIDLEKTVENQHSGLLILRSLSGSVRTELEETGVIDCLVILGISNSQSEIDAMVKSVQSKIAVKPLTPPVISAPQSAHVHDHRPVRTVPATCVNQGYTLYECACGDSYNGDFTAKVPHRYTASVIAPTELEQGYTLHKCDCCGHTYTGDIIPALHKHDYKAVETVKATCIREGYTRYVCGCGDSYRGNFTSKGPHNYLETVIAPTTESGGYTLHKCSLCDHEYKDSFTEAVHIHSHKAVQTHPATCNAEGFVRYACNCGDSYTEVIPKLAHKYVTTTVDPTDEDDGYDLHTCSLCGHSYKDNPKPAMGRTVKDSTPGGGPTVKDPTPNRNVRNFLLIRLRTGTALQVSQSMIAIGRHKHQCDFVVTGNDRISNHHADIVIYKDKVSLRDNGSTNGTFLGEKKLEADKSVALECPAFFRLHTEDFLLLWGSAADEAIRLKHVVLLKNTVQGSFRLPDKYPFLLGRYNPWADGVTMSAKDMKVGRSHAQIRFEKNTYLLERLHQTNSTRLNGRYLELGAPEKLSHGDQIRMGDTTLEFSFIDIKEINS